MKFKDDDIERVTKFVNLINEKMEFKSGLSLTEIPTIYSYLNWIQRVLIPTMEANVMEIIAQETKEEKDDRSNAKQAEEPADD